jgi:predicted secreted protein
MDRPLRCAFRVCCIALLAAGAVPLAGRASESNEPAHRVGLQVERTREVANDWVVAVVGVQDEDADAAQLADRVNRNMAWALEQARGVADVKQRSGGYNTHPVYEEGRLRRWRASHELVLESADPDALTALLGVLQSRLQLRSLEFSVSPESRRRVQDALIEEALDAFKARAEIVRANLGASGWVIDRIDVSTDGARPPRPMVHAMEARSAAVTPPAVEAGSSTLSARVSGTIALE